MKTQFVKLLVVSAIVFSLVFVGSVSAYSVSGKVTYGSTGLPVNAASVTVTTYFSNGGSASGTVVTDQLGNFSTGWPDSSCANQSMRLDATKGAFSGSTTWVAATNLESKNVTIWSTVSLNPNLGMEVGAANWSMAGTQPPIVAGAFVYNPSGPPLQINGCSATLTWDPEKVYCAAISPVGPFNYNWVPPYIDNGAGRAVVGAHAPPSMYIPLTAPPEGPMPMFMTTWEVRPFTTPDVSATTVTIDSFFDVFPTLHANPVPNRTEYQIGTSTCKPYFKLDTQSEWTQALSGGHVYAMDSSDWITYMSQWSDFKLEGQTYPPGTFRAPSMPDGDLYVYGGGGGGGGGGLDPCDAGLVMVWGITASNGNYCSAFKYDYLLDPDLTNCTITVTVTAPQFSRATGAQINQVSLGLQNIPQVGGPIRAWYWNCGAAGSGAPIIWNTPTKITIDLSKIGLAAANPAATGYANNPGFNLKAVQFIIVDENGNWVGGAGNAPSPGQGFIALWNYWHFLMVSPNTTINKGMYLKWSQPPVAASATNPPMILGWDEYSDYNNVTIVADDWKCIDKRPVTGIHWWGSYSGWAQPYPPVQPTAFHIGIWTDVPVGPSNPFSHPGELVWQNICTNYVWNFAGYDKDPRQPAGMPDQGFTEACFQYTQLLSEDQWFYQEPTGSTTSPRIYWLSIAPIWGGPHQDMHWGWKSRPHFFQDDAVSMTAFNPQGAIGIGSKWSAGIPIQFPAWPSPEGISWDMSFELLTTEFNAARPPSADLYKDSDNIVNNKDLAIFANQWLTSGQIDP